MSMSSWYFSTLLLSSGPAGRESLITTTQLTAGVSKRPAGPEKDGMMMVVTVERSVSGVRQ
jgi:hypothetical protein